MVEKPGDSKEQNDQSINFPLILKSTLTKEISNTGDLKKWEQAIYDSLGFSIKSNEDSTSITYAVFLNPRHRSDSTSLFNFVEDISTRSVSPIPIIFTVQANITKTIETNKELKQWEDKMKKMLGVEEINFRRFGGEAKTRSTYPLFETVSDCGRYPFYQDDDSDQEIMVL